VKAERIESSVLAMTASGAKQTSGKPISRPPTREKALLLPFEKEISQYELTNKQYKQYKMGSVR
jgi:hypothetical protein